MMPGIYCHCHQLGFRFLLPQCVEPFWWLTEMMPGIYCHCHQLGFGFLLPQCVEPFWWLTAHGNDAWNFIAIVTSLGFVSCFHSVKNRSGDSLLTEMMPGIYCHCHQLGFCFLLPQCVEPFWWLTGCSDNAWNLLLWKQSFLSHWLWLMVWFCSVLNCWWLSGCALCAVMHISVGLQS